jgi:catechol 2,3-dioxygenase-like lactoylglutathione lyase family enzyme
LGRIRYLAIVAKDPEAVADWYGTVFGTEVIGRSKGGDVSLSEGYFNISILKQRPELGEDARETGLHHVGLEIDSVDALRHRLDGFEPGTRLESEPGDLHHGEWRIYDPNGYPVSLSTTSFGLSTERRGLPGVRHVACAVPNTNRVIELYTRVLGMRELPTSFKRRQANLGNRFAGDGFINLAVHPHPPDKGREHGRDPKVGVNHFGFLVPDCAAVLDQLGVSPGDFQRPADRPYSEYRVYDPEGNGDISQLKGWEVDVDKWETAESSA